MARTSRNEGNRAKQVTVGFPNDPEKEKKRGEEILGIRMGLEGCMFRGPIL